MLVRLCRVSLHLGSSFFDEVDAEANGSDVRDESALEKGLGNVGRDVVRVVAEFDANRM